MEGSQSRQMPDGRRFWDNEQELRSLPWAKDKDAHWPFCRGNGPARTSLSSLLQPSLPTWGNSNHSIIILPLTQRSNSRAEASELLGLFRCPCCGCQGMRDRALDTSGFSVGEKWGPASQWDRVQWGNLTHGKEAKMLTVHYDSQRSKEITTLNIRGTGHRYCAAFHPPNLSQFHHVVG